MRHYIIPTIILLLFCFFSSCEKDDICSQNTQTTAKMVISFYEYLNPSERKTFLKLEVFEPETPENILVFENTDQIKIPLRTDIETTSYVFRLSYININQTLTNQDKIEFTYSKDDVYISRACGYKTNFSLLDSEPLNPNPKITDIANDELWIKEYIILKQLITDEDETHLDILF